MSGKSLSESGIISDLSAMSESSKDKNFFSKFSHFPIKHKGLEEYYQFQKSVFWTPQEIEFSQDRFDWEDSEKLVPEAKKFIKDILAFFAQADGIVNENLIQNFKRETSFLKEAQAFYDMQGAIERIHNETYSMLIESLFRDEEEKHKAFNAIHYYPSVKKIADWTFKWMNDKLPLAERVIAFACVEGIFFSSSFAAIYWIKRKNLLAGLCKANEFIARDEALHTKFAIALYHTLSGIEKKFKPLEPERVHEIITSATETAEEFTQAALPKDLIGMKCEDMIKYVRCTSNSLAVSLGYKPIYDVTNPFDWMAVISLPNKTNFFESRSTEYSRSDGTNFDFDFEDVEF